MANCKSYLWRSADLMWLLRFVLKVLKNGRKQTVVIFWSGLILNWKNQPTAQIYLSTRDVKRSSYFQISNNMFEFKFRTVTFDICFQLHPANCSPFGLGSTVVINQHQQLTRNLPATTLACHSTQQKCVFLSPHPPHAHMCMRVVSDGVRLQEQSAQIAEVSQ